MKLVGRTGPDGGAQDVTIQLGLQFAREVERDWSNVEHEAGVHVCWDGCLGFVRPWY